MTGLMRLNEVWDASLAPTSESYNSTGSKSYLIEDYLEEGKKLLEVDGKIILGKISGPSFFGDGVSRNQRFYPRALWERQLSLPRIQERLRDRVMLGQIGHADGAVTENDVAAGMVSHIVTNLHLREDNQGISELLILNTPAGRNLYTLMKAGSRLKISTRAQGKFLEGKTHNGMPIVDPDSFILETLDIVINPGFVEVDPRLQESLEQKIADRVRMLEFGESKKINSGTGINIKENKEKHTMELQEQLIQEARSNAKIYEDLYKEQKKLREEAEDEKEKAEKETEECKKELEECKRELAAYKQIGEAADIARDLQEYAELGFTSPVEAKFMLEALQEEAEDAIDGDEVEDIKKDIEEACKLLAQYEELGTPEELKDIKDKATELADELDKKATDECVARLAVKHNLPESIVRKIVEATEDEDEADKECEDCKESLEGMADPTGDDELEDYENDNELPNKTNDNVDVTANPTTVEESLDAFLGEGLKASRGKAKSAIMEGYKPGSIVSQMFS